MIWRPKLVTPEAGQASTDPAEVHYLMGVLREVGLERARWLSIGQVP